MHNPAMAGCKLNPVLEIKKQAKTFKHETKDKVRKAVLQKLRPD